MSALVTTVTDLLVHYRADRALVAEVVSSHGSRRPARHLHHSQVANRFGKNQVANQNGDTATAETLRMQNRSLDRVSGAFA